MSYQPSRPDPEPTPSYPPPDYYDDGSLTYLHPRANTLERQTPSLWSPPSAIDLRLTRPDSQTSLLSRHGNFPPSPGGRERHRTRSPTSEHRSHWWNFQHRFHHNWGSHGQRPADTGSSSSHHAPGMKDRNDDSGFRSSNSTYDNEQNLKPENGSYVSVHDVSLDPAHRNNRCNNKVPGRPPSESESSKYCTFSVDSNSYAGQSDSSSYVGQSDKGARRCRLLRCGVIILLVLAFLGLAGGVAYLLVRDTSTPPALALDNPDVNVTDINPPPPAALVGYQKNPVLLTFDLPDQPSPASSLRLVHGEVDLFNLSLTGSGGNFQLERMLVDVSVEDGGMQVVVTALNLSCSDEGNFTLVVRREDGEEITERMSLTVTRRPHFPVLVLPSFIAETVTTDNPECRVSSLGYPPKKVTWVLRLQDGRSLIFPESRLLDEADDAGEARTDSCEAVGTKTSILDAGGYVGWNNSALCCQIQDPETLEVYFETCQQMLTLPGNFCDEGDGLKQYPYEPCYTFVECSKREAHAQFCPKESGFCFDASTQRCDQEDISTGTSTEAPPNDECGTEGVSYVARPDTYPHHCHLFYRCVGSSQVNETCGPGLEFPNHSLQGSSEVVCSLPSPDTYCGQKFSEEPPLVQPLLGWTANVTGNVTLTCVITRLKSLRKVEVLRGETLLADFNVTENAVTASPKLNRVEGEGERRGEGRNAEVEVQVTLSSLECSDEAVYTCRALGEESYQHNQSARLQLTRPPEAPTIHIPAGLVAEYRSLQKPNCSTDSLGYNPTMDFNWVLRSSSGDQPMPATASDDSISQSNCDSQGTSRLDAGGYVGWNRKDLCCQLVDPTNDNSVVEESCAKVKVLAAVEMADKVVATIDKNASIQCLARSVSEDVQIEFKHGDTQVATFNGSEDTGNTSSAVTSIQAVYDGEIMTTTLEFSQVTCSDGGSYTCIAKDDGIDAEASTTLLIHRPPDSPVLTVKDAVEDFTELNPYCFAANMGFNPIYNLTWIRRNPDGTSQLLFPEGKIRRQHSTDKQTCSSATNSTLNVNKYVGLNNTELCCQIRHPDTSDVVDESCSHLRLVPRDFCQGNIGETLLNPYDSCKWLKCEGLNPVLYAPCQDDLCYDLNQDQCIFKH